MATDEKVASLRRMAGEPTTDTYTNEALSAIWDAAGSADGAAAAVWREKAAALADLVNTSESGSSRSMGDLYKNALEMARFYEKKVADALTPVVPSGDYPMTVDIERA